MTNPHEAHFDILIVGASYAGLAMARALSVRLAGHVTIGLLDRDQPGTPGKNDPRASALSAGAVNVLRRLGLWDGLEDKAQPVERIDITDPVGDSPLRQILLSYENTTDSETPASWVVENADLKAALVAAVTGDPHITICAPGAVSGWAADTGTASVTLASEQKLHANLVIAADGANSRLRQAAGIKTTGWPYNQTGIVTTVRHERPHNATATQHFLPAGPFAILPLRGNRASIVWTEETGIANRLMQCGDTDFLAALQDRLGTRLGACELAGPRASWPLRLQLARQLTATRLALIGDAARTVHPIAGQGLNLAVRDIAALTDIIANAVSLGIDPGNAEALSGYEQWRRFDSSTSALTFDAINRLFSNSNALVRSVRDAGLELVGRSPALKSFFVREAAGLTGDKIPSLMAPFDANPGATDPTAGAAPAVRAES